MSQLGTLPPGLPNPPGQPAGVLQWASALVQALTRVLGGVLSDLGQQPSCPEFTTATKPAAAGWKRRIIFVSDGGAGAKFQASDGTNWVNLG